MKTFSLALVLAASLAPLGLAGCQTVEEDGYVYSSTYDRPSYRGVYETDYVYRDRSDTYRRPPPPRYGQPPYGRYEPPPQRRYDPPPQRRYDPPPQRRYDPPPQRGYEPPRGAAAAPAYGNRGGGRAPDGAPWLPQQDPLQRSPSH